MNRKWGSSNGCRPCPTSGISSFDRGRPSEGEYGNVEGDPKAAIVLATSLIAATLLALPAAGKSRLPPEDDGSTYTWPSATTVTVDVEPWGGGYVRSTPYLIDCPLACIRPFDAGTRGDVHGVPDLGLHLRVVDRRLRGPDESLHGDDLRRRARRHCGLQRPLRAADVPAAPGPALSLNVSGACPGCVATAIGTGFHPNSSITLFVEISSPPLGSADVSRFRDDGLCRTWSFVATVHCDFGSGPFVGQFKEDVTRDGCRRRLRLGAPVGELRRAVTSLARSALDHLVPRSDVAEQPLPRSARVLAARDRRPYARTHMRILRDIHVAVPRMELAVPGYCWTPWRFGSDPYLCGSSSRVSDTRDAM